MTFHFCDVILLWLIHISREYVLPIYYSLPAMICLSLQKPNRKWKLTPTASWICSPRSPRSTDWWCHRCTGSRSSWRRSIDQLITWYRSTVTEVERVTSRSCMIGWNVSGEGDDDDQNGRRLRPISGCETICAMFTALSFNVLDSLMPGSLHVVSRRGNHRAITARVK